MYLQFCICSNFSFDDDQRSNFVGVSLNSHMDHKNYKIFLEIVKYFKVFRHIKIYNYFRYHFKNRFTPFSKMCIFFFNISTIWDVFFAKTNSARNKSRVKDPNFESESSCFYDFFAHIFVHNFHKCHGQISYSFSVNMCISPIYFYVINLPKSVNASFFISQSASSPLDELVSNKSK